eukprot:2914278-Karenia_brevis.AAC.1
MPDHGSNFFDNDHFKTAMQLGLGMVLVLDGSVCQIVKHGSAENAGAAVGASSRMQGWPSKAEATQGGCP